MAKVRATIIVDGDVQGVGYRYYVRRAARKHKLVGYVENLEDGTVEIVCEGEEEDIKAFIGDIDIKEAPIFVEEIVPKFSEAAVEFKVFKVVTGSLEEEMVEGFSTGMVYIQTVRDEVRGARDDVRGVGDEVRGVRGEVKDFREESRENFGKMFEKQEATTQELHDFRVETKGGFSELGERYHVISEELISINKNIARVHEDIAELIKYIAMLVEDHIKREKRG